MKQLYSTVYSIIIVIMFYATVGLSVKLFAMADNSNSFDPSTVFGSGEQFDFAAFAEALAKAIEEEEKNNPEHFNTSLNFPAPEPSFDAWPSILPQKTKNFSVFSPAQQTMNSKDDIYSLFTDALENTINDKNMQGNNKKPLFTKKKKNAYYYYMNNFTGTLQSIEKKIQALKYSNKITPNFFDMYVAGLQQAATESMISYKFINNHEGYVLVFFTQQFNHLRVMIANLIPIMKEIDQRLEDLLGDEENNTEDPLMEALAYENSRQLVAKQQHATVKKTEHCVTSKATNLDKKSFFKSDDNPFLDVLKQQDTIVNSLNNDSLNTPKNIVNEKKDDLVRKNSLIAENYLIEDTPFNFVSILKKNRLSDIKEKLAHIVKETSQISTELIKVLDCPELKKVITEERQKQETAEKNAIAHASRRSNSGYGGFNRYTPGSYSPHYSNSGYNHYQRPFSSYVNPYKGNYDNSNYHNYNQSSYDEYNPTTNSEKPKDSDAINRTEDKKNNTTQDESIMSNTVTKILDTLKKECSDIEKNMRSGSTIAALAKQMLKKNLFQNLNALCKTMDDARVKLSDQTSKKIESSIASKKRDVCTAFFPYLLEAIILSSSSTLVSEQNQAGNFYTNFMQGHIKGNVNTTVAARIAPIVTKFTNKLTTIEQTLKNSTATKSPNAQDVYIQQLEELHEELDKTIDKFSSLPISSLNKLQDEVYKKINAQ